MTRWPRGSTPTRSSPTCCRGCPRRASPPSFTTTCCPTCGRPPRSPCRHDRPRPRGERTPAPAAGRPVRGGNRFGVLVCGTDRLLHRPARQGRSALMASLAVVHDSARQTRGPAEGAGVAAAFRRLQVTRPRRSQVVVVSDFLGDEAWAQPLRALARHHQVIAVHVTDPRELVLPAVGMLAVVDTETGRQRYVQ